MKKHYTLIELTATAAAILLMGVLVMSVPLRGLDAARGKSAVLDCQNNLKQLGAAAAAYAADHNDLLPAGNTPYREHALRWNYALSSLLPGKKLPICGAAAEPAKSYGANYCYNTKRNARIPFYYFDSQKPEASKLAKYSVQLPEIILFADAESATMLSPRQLGCAPALDVSGNGIKDSARNTKFSYYAPQRHANSLNYVSCSGAVRNISFEVWEDQMNNSGIIYNEKFNY